jgi:hypothetical protein
VITVAYAVGVAAAPPRRMRWPAAAVAAALAAGLALSPGGAAPGRRAPGRSIEQERSIWLPRIERHVLGRSPYAKVFVCGYDSFRLLGSETGPVFAHALDLNFHQVKNDYYGHTLFVLVHRPEGRSAMDSIHWQVPRMFELGHRETLYDGDWGPWRLFEIIQAPRRDALP